MRPGQVVRLRSTEEPVAVVAVLDAGGAMLLVRASEGEFEVHRDEVVSDAERHGCACCA